MTPAYQQPEFSLNFDKEIAIATAQTRVAKKWKNKSVLISEFAAQLSVTARTHEKYAEYVNLNKEDQDKIKDVGAFVGGALKGGSRRKEDVANRHIVTLDIDYANVESLSTIETKLKDCCYTLYSTHKHSQDKPRYRLIVYPDRPMLPDEYQAVARKIASKIDIETVDDTSYDINRLFYWPSSSIDSEFVYRHNDAPFLSVDNILISYGLGNLWRDVTMWPVSSRETLHITRLLKKQVDPLTKKNIVGSWCRFVSIHDAMDIYLSDIYRKESNNRYTYIEGSTSKGVVVYNDKFVYSNHSSDPAHGQTCNAWDIVRIHKFGYLDSNVSEGSFGNKLPSYKEMNEFARSFPEVKADLIKSGLEIDVNSFDDFGKGEFGGDWTAELQISGDKTIKANWHNLKTILKNDVELKNKMKLNEFTEREERYDGKLWSDYDSSVIKSYLGKTYEIDPAAQKLEEVISYQAKRNSYHPIRKYIESLQWDGTPRVETLWIDYLGCEDNAYTRQSCMCWFSAAIHRIYNPGHKFDYVPVLEGQQGIMKSTFISVLAKEEWFGNLTSFENKIAMEEISGKWIIEMDELAASSKQELEQQKAFLSARSTTVRMAYARRSQEFKRQCVFIGTTNNREYLKDSTGNRRWWPIRVNVPKINIVKLRDEVDQIWAEAYETLYSFGYRTYLDDAVELIAKDVQKSRMVEDPWEGIIKAWLDRDAEVDRYEIDNIGQSSLEERDKVCTIEIWQDALNNKTDMRKYDQNRISGIMNNVDDWEPVSSIRFGSKYGIQRGWRRKLKSVVPF